MSLLRNIERRDLSSTKVHDALRIPRNSELAPSPFTPTFGGGAMRHPVVWACVRMISDAIKSFRVDLMAGPGPTGTPADSLPNLLRKPSANLNMVEWLGQVTVSVILHGNAYGLISSRNSYGYPTQINPVPVGAITAMWDDNGRKIYKGRNGQIIPNDQVWHLAGLAMPGEAAGVDLSTFHAQTFDLGLSATEYLLKYLINGAHPTAVASTDQQVTEDQAEIMRQRAAKAMSSRGVIVAGAGIKFEPWQGSPNDAQIGDIIRLNAAEVCWLFGMVPEDLSISVGGSTLTYANREQRAQDFVKRAVKPWLMLLQASMSDWFPPNRYVEFDTSDYTMPDTKTLTDTFSTATGGKPWLQPSEVRARLHLAPLPGIDDAPPQPSPAVNDGNPNPQG